MYHKLTAIKGKNSEELVRSFDKWAGENESAVIHSTFHFVEVTPSKTGLMTVANGGAVDHTIVLMVVWSSP